MYKAKEALKQFMAKGGELSPFKVVCLTFNFALCALTTCTSKFLCAEINKTFKCISVLCTEGLLPPKLQRRGLVFKWKLVTMERV